MTVAAREAQRRYRTVKKRAVLLALEHTPDFADACRVAQVPYRTAWGWLNTDPGFQAEAYSRLDQAMGRIINVQYQKALDGDTASAKLLLAALDRQKRFVERREDTLNVNVTHDLSGLANVFEQLRQETQPQPITVDAAPALPAPDGAQQEPETQA